MKLSGLPGLATQCVAIESSKAKEKAGTEFPSSPVPFDTRSVTATQGYGAYRGTRLLFIKGRNRVEKGLSSRASQQHEFCNGPDLVPNQAICTSL